MYLAKQIVSEDFYYSRRLCTIHGPAEELGQNPPFPYRGTRTGRRRTWTVAFGSDEVLDALLFPQVTLCSNTLKRYELALVMDVDGVGTEVSALLLTARYGCFPPSSASLLLHPSPKRRLARGVLAPSPNGKCCFVSWFCPAPYEKSGALKAARVARPRAAF